MPTWVPINSQTIGAGVTQVTFNSFSGYTDLVLILAAAPALSGNAFYVTFNNNAGSYAWLQLLGGSGGTPVSNTGSANYTKIVNNLDSSTNNFSASYIWIPNYSSSSFSKQILSRSGGATNGVIWTSSGWASTAPITSIEFKDETGGAMRQGSTFTLYGILAA